MPAKHLNRVSEEGTYFHIYNKGIEDKIIFGDDEDYEVFLGFLRDYLTPPPDPESVKKEFSVNGRTFRGRPHQPKNYYDRVELLAYGLVPDHFHLILHQKAQGSLPGFIRSLCTRYSMYFNKKYQRSGALFAGPYKSVEVEDTAKLLELTRYIHNHGEGGQTSIREYLGQRETPWVKVAIHEKYEIGQKDMGLLEGIILESVEGRDLTRATPIQQPSFIHRFRIPEVVGFAAVFLILVTLGIRNIKASPLLPEPTPTPSATPVPIVEEEPKMMVVIKISDGSESVNIRQSPTVRSEKIGKALDGERFELISTGDEWYEVRLEDGTSGFISERYVSPVETNN